MSNDPTIKEKIKNLMKATADYVKSGFVNVTDEQYKERLDICSICEFKSENWKCNACGCNLLIKARMQSSTCPKDKWSKIEDNNGEGCGCSKST